jgi:hypothetical protein
MEDDVKNHFKKGKEWMPWLKDSMKDVASCDKLRGAAKQALNRRFPNGETQYELCRITSKEEITVGTETSKYHGKRNQ